MQSRSKFLILLISFVIVISTKSAKISAIPSFEEQCEKHCNQSYTQLEENDWSEQFREHCNCPEINKTEASSGFSLSKPTRWLLYGLVGLSVVTSQNLF